jgi:hypothetical protein
VGFARERQWFSIEETGVIEGMEDLETGKGIDFKPYVLAKYFSTEENDDFDFESGFDLFYQWTPSLTATLTLNTDFAETETFAFSLEDNRTVSGWPSNRLGRWS